MLKQVYLKVPGRISLPVITLHIKKLVRELKINRNQ